MLARDLSDKNIYVQSVKLNGKDWNTPLLPYAELRDGGELVFTMGSKPNMKWGVDAEKGNGVIDYRLMEESR